ncbi:MAG: 2-oxoglutarate carboxylase large subunit [Verrucomicrobia bacterium ADurb.Bin474]|nr:MAG: 2-oxoglutarate carboxylase large subunit [Verrucomicrobia bacterium ADurb.Bin474]
MRIYELTVGNKAYNVKVKSFSSHQAELEVNGKLMKVDVKAIGDDLVGKPVARAAAPSSTAPVRAAPVSAKKMPVAGAGAITAPIPGAILEIFVKEGQEIKAGQPVLKMEAMKMENVIQSHLEGTILSISVQPKDAVSQGQELMTVG